MAKSEWNYRPDVPIATNPLFAWPPRPIAALKWYADAWFWVTLNGVMVAIAAVCYVLFSPRLADTGTLSLDWIALIWVRNFVLLCAVATPLHLWFHTYAGQGNHTKYDPRPFPRKGRMFTFDDQVKDNIFWSLASGVTVWSGFECLIWWAMAHGWAGTLTWDDNPALFIALFALVPVWESFYFYWVHRLLHTDLLYRFHALHHRNTDVGPWSGMSMHPVEHIFFFGTALIHFVVPTHPLHLIFHLMYYALFAVTTHTGFESLWFLSRKRMALGTFHHQIHHRYFEVNYGSLDVPWDKLFGSFHDGTEGGKAKMKERLKTRTRR